MERQAHEVNRPAGFQAATQQIAVARQRPGVRQQLVAARKLSGMQREQVKRQQQLESEGLISELELTEHNEAWLDAEERVLRLETRLAAFGTRELEAEAKQTGELATLLPEVKFLRQWVIDLREPRSDLTELLPLADWVAMKTETEAA